MGDHPPHPSESLVLNDADADVPRAGAQPVTIVLADDHRAIRAGLKLLLESESRFTVLAETSDVTATFTAILEHRPQVLVLDLNLGGESSLDAIPRLRADAPDTQIVVLTMQENPAFARAALDAGAAGYVLKDAADAELTDAVRSAAAGRTHITASLRARLAAEPPQDAGLPDGLSPREVEVLRLIALGYTNPEIAATLTLSVRTVESHRAHIHQKIEANTRAELVAYAAEHDLTG
jgi:two-component system response regulator NreC